MTVTDVVVGLFFALELGALVGCLAVMFLLEGATTKRAMNRSRPSDLRRADVQFMDRFGPSGGRASSPRPAARGPARSLP